MYQTYHQRIDIEHDTDSGHALVESCQLLKDLVEWSEYDQIVSVHALGNMAQLYQDTLTNQSTMQLLARENDPYYSHRDPTKSVTPRSRGYGHVMATYIRREESTNVYRLRH